MNIHVDFFMLCCEYRCYRYADHCECYRNAGKECSTKVSLQTKSFPDVTLRSAKQVSNDDSEYATEKNLNYRSYNPSI